MWGTTPARPPKPISSSPDQKIGEQVKPEPTNQNAEGSDKVIAEFQNLGSSLFYSSFLSDVTILAGPKKKPYKAHKYIIALNSGYFRTLFSSDRFKEANENELFLAEHRSTVINQTLYWLYYGSFEPTNCDGGLT